MEILYKVYPGMPPERSLLQPLEIRNCGYGMYGKSELRMRYQDIVERRIAELCGWANMIVLLPLASPR
jgi:hypothetical protein